MLFRETVAVYCENHTEHINILRYRLQSYSVLNQVILILPLGYKYLRHTRVLFGVPKWNKFLITCRTTV
jgi:hypothetical protein